MSSIDKLLIRGIRSFDPSGTNIIDFYTPLTIIVGHNGAGKTTVIECLKYATTGDLPPNSRNGAFIHDPKLAHETEVKAQIKLRFKNVNGREMVATRSISLTQKKTSMTQKTLESLLHVYDPETGEKSSLSTKCAELDAEIPMQLGASKAILENVIFCHQEESFWPLSEPGTLKKKFDEIFAATRYTKALEAIKSLRKEQVAELKLEQANLDHLKTDKEKARRIRDTLAGLDEKLAVAQERIELLEGDRGEIKTTRDLMDEISNRHTELQQLEWQIENSEQEYKRLQKDFNELKQILQEYTVSDQELEDMLQTHEASLGAKQEVLNKLEQQRSQLQRDVDRLQGEHKDKLTERGKLESAQERHLLALKDRETLVLELSRKHAYSGFDATPLSTADVERFVRKLSGDIAKKLSGLEAIKAEAQTKENAIRSDVNRLEKSKSTLEENKRMIRERMNKVSGMIRELTQKMHNVRVSQSDVDEATSRFEEEESSLAQTMRNYNPGEYEAKIRKINQEINDCEYNLGKVNDELSLLNRQADTRARLSIKLGEKDSKEQTLNKAVAGAKEGFIQNMGHAPPEQEMGREVQNLIRDKENAVKDSEQQFELKRKDLHEIETKLSLAKSELQKKKQEVEGK